MACTDGTVETAHLLHRSIALLILIILIIDVNCERTYCYDFSFYCHKTLGFIM